MNREDRVYIAALADTVSTEVILAHGGRELNPLGVAGAFVGKSVYLLGIRPAMSAEQRAEGDRIAVSIWTSASVVNTVQLIAPFTALGVVVGGGLLARAIWLATGP